MAPKVEVSDEKKERVKRAYRIFRSRSNLNTKDIAAMCGVQIQTLYNVCSRGEISPGLAVKLAEVFGCTAEELLTGNLSQKSFMSMASDYASDDLELASDEKLWMRAMMLSQQRTIENLSFVTKEKVKGGEL